MATVRAARVGAIALFPGYCAAFERDFGHQSDALKSAAKVAASASRRNGPDRAAALARDTLREIGIHGVHTPNDRMRFSGALLRNGWLLEVIGRAIRVQAILRGAAFAMHNGRPAC